MKHSHGSHLMKDMRSMGHSHHTMGKQIVKGSMASASVRSGEKIMGKLAKHPLLIFGLGVVAGYVIYKYRKDIVSSVGKATDTSKDFSITTKIKSGRHRFEN